MIVAHEYLARVGEGRRCREQVVEILKMYLVEFRFKVDPWWKMYFDREAERRFPFLAPRRWRVTISGYTKAVRAAERGLEPLWSNPGIETWELPRAGDG